MSLHNKPQHDMMLAIGLMSGTSFDGVDAGLIRSDGQEKIELLGGITMPYPQSLRKRLKDIMNASLKDLLVIEDMLTREHIKAIYELLRIKHYTSQDIALVGFHGQTVIHIPSAHLTWQIGNPNLISYETRIDTVADFRRKDMAAKGQGAPFVPIFHQALSAKLPKAIAFLNIGGVANLTYIDTDHLIAFDTGPGMAPIDDIVEEATGAAFDGDGSIASQGNVNKQILEHFLQAPYLRQPPPKSLDRSGFNFNLLYNLHLQDKLATLCAIIANTVEIGLGLMPTKPKQIIVSGGGRKNKTIMTLLRQTINTEVHTIDDILEVDGDLVEAYAFGYLAIRSKKNLPLSFPSTTLAPHPMSGGAFYRA